MRVAGRSTLNRKRCNKRWVVRFVRSIDYQLRTAHPSNLPLTGKDEIFKNNPFLVSMDASCYARV